MKIENIPNIYQAGDQAVIVVFEETISPEINLQVHSLKTTIENYGFEEIIELVPGYASLLVGYDANLVSSEEIRAKILGILSNGIDLKISSDRVIEIPVLYGGKHGPDLDEIADKANIQTDDLIQMHSAEEYLVYMIAFTPGFPYLGGLNKKLEAKRLATARTKVPAGSVGIAGLQTGIYPIESSGGWRLIGRTPLRLFDPYIDSPFLLAPGDYVKFKPIDGSDEFQEIEEQVRIMDYKPNVISR